MRTEAMTRRTARDATEGRKGPAGHIDLHIPSTDREGELLEKIQTSLVQEVSLGFKLKVEDIYLDRELSEYGFDSIGFTALAHQLNQAYGLELLPTIFFEHPTLGEVARYLVQHHRAGFAAKFAHVTRSARVSAEANSSDLRPRSMDQEGELLEKIQTSLVQEVSLGFKLKVEDVYLDRELSEYGFDSISFTALAHQLNQRYGLALMPTMFFEHPTLGDVARLSGRASPRGICGEVCAGDRASRRTGTGCGGEASCAGASAPNAR